MLFMLARNDRETHGDMSVQETKASYTCSRLSRHMLHKDLQRYFGDSSMLGLVRISCLGAEAVTVLPGMEMEKVVYH